MALTITVLPLFLPPSLPPYVCVCAKHTCTRSRDRTVYSLAHSLTQFSVLIREGPARARADAAPNGVVLEMMVKEIRSMQVVLSTEDSYNAS